MSAKPTEEPDKGLWWSHKPIQEERKDSNGIVHTTPEDLPLASDVLDGRRQSPPLTEPIANQPMTVNENPKTFSGYPDEVESSEEEEQFKSCQLDEARETISKLEEKVTKLEEENEEAQEEITKLKEKIQKFKEEQQDEKVKQEQIATIQHELEKKQNQLQGDKDRLTEELKKKEQQLKEEEELRDRIVQQELRDRIVQQTTEISNDRVNFKMQIADLHHRLHNLNIRKSLSHAQELDRNPESIEEADCHLTPVSATVAAFPQRVDKSRTSELLRPLIGDVRVQLIGTSLGSGAFGTVKEVVLEDCTQCAGKIFRRDTCATSQNLSRKFLTEYSILKELDHIHIVRYYGSHTLPDSYGSDLPMLLMERLSTSLRSYYFDCEYSNLCIDLHTKVFTILLGVAKGLAYLHSKGVIHRDLHDNNILLRLDASSMVTCAKIADFGNSRITGKDISSQIQNMTMTPIPIYRYMPPEAESGTYTDKLDMFSYGHLALLVVTKDSLQILKSVKLSSSGLGGYYMARTEVNRRQHYIDKMIDCLGDQHFLVELVKQCLSDEPDSRPSAKSIIGRFETVPVDPISSVHKDTAIAPQKVESSDSDSFPDIN